MATVLAKRRDQPLNRLSGFRKIWPLSGACGDTAACHDAANHKNAGNRDRGDRKLAGFGQIICTLPTGRPGAGGRGCAWPAYAMLEPTSAEQL